MAHRQTGEILGVDILWVTTHVDKGNSMLSKHQVCETQDEALFIPHHTPCRSHDKRYSVGPTPIFILKTLPPALHFVVTSASVELSKSLRTTMLTLATSATNGAFPPRTYVPTTPLRLAAASTPPVSTTGRNIPSSGASRMTKVSIIMGLKWRGPATSAEIIR